MGAIKNKLLYVSLGTLLAASSASAKSYVNSMCTMRANSQSKVIEGDKNKDDKFPLASISKVVTSLWALEKLGANYRYTTKIHVTPVGNDTFDVHIQGGRDPIFGRNASYFLISELNRLNVPVKKIENLTFDENFLLDWLAEEKPRIGGDTPYYETMQEQAEAVRKSLIQDFATAINSTYYNSLRLRSAKAGIEMAKSPKVSVRRVEFKSSKQFSKEDDTQTLLYKSAPLHTIIKRMNNQSNNYIADHLFWNLGGRAEFSKYVEKTLSMDSSDIVFYLGSGNNADYLNDSDKALYNEATCEAMIKVLYRMDQVMEKIGMELTSVLAVAGVDKGSTVAGYGGYMAGSMMAKTGSVNKAKTLSGVVNTKNGEIYFTVLMHTDSRVDWGSASTTIKAKINKLIMSNGGAKKIDYSEIIPLPFDKSSKLTTEVAKNLESKG